MHEQTVYWGRRVGAAISSLETTVEAVTSSVDYLDQVFAESQNFDSYDRKEAVAKLLESLEDLRGSLITAGEATAKLAGEGRKL